MKVDFKALKCHGRMHRNSMKAAAVADELK